MKFKTPWSYTPDHQGYERNPVIILPNGTESLMASMTVPDQAFSVKEILSRHQRGLSTTTGKVPIYDGEELVPDFDRMDMIDRQDFMRNAQAKLDEIHSDQKIRNKSMKDQKAQAEFNQAQKDLEAAAPGTLKNSGQGQSPAAGGNKTSTKKVDD